MALSLKVLEEVLLQLDVAYWGDVLDESDIDMRRNSEKACKHMLDGNESLWTVTIRDTRWMRINGKLVDDLAEGFLEMLMREIQWPVLSGHYPRWDDRENILCWVEEDMME